MSSQLLKLLIIGDSGVGKSCILSRFCEDRFTDAFYNTIGVDFKTKTMWIEDKAFKLQIWDTAGQERFRTITANYYKGAHGILIVFDLSNQESLNNINFWLEQIDKHGNSHPALILIGNKSDIAKRQVSQDEALKFAKENKLDYIECSAYNSLNINLVFEAIVKKISRERTKREEGCMQTPGAKKEEKVVKKLQKNKREEQKKNETGCC